MKRTRNFLLRYLDWSRPLMGYVLLGAALGLFPSLMMTLLYLQQMKSHETDRKSWTSERESLLNRCMTKEWQSYQMMAIPTSSNSPFEPYAGEYIPGMSDEEELKRMGFDLTNSQGVGELDDFDSDMLGDSGFRVEQ